jgi:hypothetical protein
MPIATRTFDLAFTALGLQLKTSQQCSWDNYCRYNAVLSEVREALREITTIRSVRLIDAHSFCWILVREAFDVRGRTDPKISIPVSLQGMKSALGKTDSNPKSGLASTVADDFFLLRGEAQRLLGQLAETIAIRSEQLRLQAAGCTALANAVRSVSNQPALGYDINSFEADGRNRYIEVKAARFSKGRFDFFVTRNEVAKSCNLQNYHFYLVVDAESGKPEVFDVKANELSADCLSPVNYIASLAVPKRKPS